MWYVTEVTALGGQRKEALWNLWQVSLDELINYRFEDRVHLKGSVKK